MAANTYEELRAEISAKHETLSKRLQQVAQFALGNPNDMALETVAVIAERAKVQPSTLIRFAKAFGLEGFSDMQRVFRSRLIDQVPSYQERIRELRTGGGEGLDTQEGIFVHFVSAGMHALEHLRDDIRPERLERAVALLAEARTIHVIGHRRAFAVAAYLSYGLGHLERPIHLLDNIGGMLGEQMPALTRGDVLLAVSFQPYAPETMRVVRHASDNGIPIVAITDMPFSPLSPFATVAFEVEDAQVRGFRSLTATMCLAVSLVVGVGRHLANGINGTSVGNGHEH